MRALLARVAVVAVLAIVAHNAMAWWRGDDWTRTLLGCAAIIAANLSLAVFMPSTEAGHARLAGVACLAAFAASYWQQLALRVAGSPTLHTVADQQVRTIYLCVAAITGTLAAAFSACRLLDPWVAARFVHGAHSIAFAAYAIAASRLAADGPTITLPPGETPREQGAAYVAVHGLLACMLTASARNRISRWASSGLGEGLASPSGFTPRPLDWASGLRADSTPAPADAAIVVELAELQGPQRLQEQQVLRRPSTLVELAELQGVQRLQRLRPTTPEATASILMGAALHNAPPTASAASHDRALDEQAPPRAHFERALRACAACCEHLAGDGSIAQLAGPGLQGPPACNASESSPVSDGEPDHRPACYPRGCTPAAPSQLDSVGPVSADVLAAAEDVARRTRDALQRGRPFAPQPVRPGGRGPCSGPSGGAEAPWGETLD